MSLILALQISHKETIAATELCQLCADIEAGYEPRKDCEFWIECSEKVSSETAERLVSILSPKFVSRWFRARNKGEGHPYGANQLWLSTMVEVWGQYKHSIAFREAFNGILTFETDCVPMRKDWIELLTNEWDKHLEETRQWNKANPESHIQFECMGHVHQDGTVHKHINGNAIFRPDMLERRMIESPEVVGWDFYKPNREYLVSVGRDTNLITQYYSRPTITIQEMAHVKKGGIVPALFHGVKDGSARKLVRGVLIK
jgi:hypothetical protein